MGQALTLVWLQGQSSCDCTSFTFLLADTARYDISIRRGAQRRSAAVATVVKMFKFAMVSAKERDARTPLISGRT